MKRNKQTWLIASATLLTVGAVGCSSSSTTSTDVSAVSLSGTLSATTTSSSRVSSSSKYRHGDDLIMAKSSPVFSVDPTLYKVSCTSMDDPSNAVSGTVDSSGKFTVSNIPVNGVACSIVNIADDSTYSITFKNPYDKDLSGNSKTVDRIRPSSDADMGTVTFDTDSGSASVTLSAANSSALGSSATVDNPFDFSGTWVFSKADFTVPKGYSDICAAGSNDCRGPTAGETVYLLRVDGKAFTPDSTCTALKDADALNESATCSGTTGTAAKYGILAFSSKTAFEACGSRLGFTFDQAKGYGGVDFTGATNVNSGAPVFSTSDGNGNTITDGWKFSNATANWAVNDCGPATVDGKSAWKCHDSVNDTYAIFLNEGNGCKNASGSAVELRDWSSVSWSSNTTTDVGGGYYKYTNVGTYNGATITCTNTQGYFNAAGTAISSSNFNYNNVSTILAQGAACSTINDTTDALKLTKLQCYANAYWNARNNVGSGVCLRKLRTNWGATSPDEFINAHGPAKSDSQHVAEILNYTSNDTASFTMYEDDYRGVQSGNAWINCHLGQKMTISMKKRSDTVMVMEFTTETTNLDAAISACKAAESNLGVGVSKYFTVATKQ